MRQTQIASLDEKGQKKLYYRLIEEMKSICDDADIHFLVVFVYPKEYFLENEGSPSLQVTEELTLRGIDHLDLFERLKSRELNAEKSLYYVEDFHWNTRGHEFVAAVLKEYIDDWKDNHLR